MITTVRGHFCFFNGINGTAVLIIIKSVHKGQFIYYLMDPAFPITSKSNINYSSTYSKSASFILAIWSRDTFSDIKWS